MKIGFYNSNIGNFKAELESAGCNKLIDTTGKSLLQAIHAIQPVKLIMLPSIAHVGDDFISLKDLMIFLKENKISLEFLNEENCAFYPKKNGDQIISWILAIYTFEKYTRSRKIKKGLSVSTKHRNLIDESDKEQFLLDAENMSRDAQATKWGISPGTLRNYLKKWKH